MPVEIEAKMKLTDASATRERLKLAGATFERRELETNIFFDTKESALSLADKALRVRVAKDELTGKQKCKIAFKGPRQTGQFKNRDERQLVIEDADDAAHLFEAFGFIRTVSFQKRRETWQLGDCEVVLDEVPYLGSFIEIEGPSESAVSVVREKLELGDAKLISESYISMLVKYLKENRIEARDITF